MTTGSAAAIITASPDAAFRAVTDVGGLPNWNRG